MRKYFLIVLVFMLAIVNPLFASTGEDSIDLFKNDIFTISAKRDGFGGAVFTERGDIFLNPASLARDGLDISIPYFAARLYNPSDVIEGIKDAEGSKTQILDAIFTEGVNHIADVEAGIGFNAKGFGLNIKAQESLYSNRGKISSVWDSSLSSKLSLTTVLGYGHRFQGKKTYLDAGFSTGLSISAIHEDLLLNEFKTHGGLKKALMNNPVAVYVSMPFALSMDFVVPFSLDSELYLSAAVRDPAIFSFSNVYTKGEDVSLSNIFKVTFAGQSAQTCQIDFGIGYHYDKFASCRAELDIVDIQSMLMEMMPGSLRPEGYFKLPYAEKGIYKCHVLLDHIRAGLEFGILGLEGRVGLRGDVFTTGATIDLNIVQVDVAYSMDLDFCESVYNSYEPSMLSVAFNLGWN